MYDMTFVISCCVSQPLYAERLAFFRDWCLPNCGDYNIKVILNANNEDDIGHESLHHWPYDTEIMVSPYSHECPKTYHFYANVKKRHIEETKWMMKVDDDSITDVSRVLDEVNGKFRYTDPVFIMSTKSMLGRVEGMYHGIMKDFGMGKYAKAPYNIREAEACIHSQQSLNLISNNPLTKPFYNRVINEIGVKGKGDALNSAIAQHSGSKLGFVDSWSWQPYFESFCTKRLSHIHYVYYIKAKKPYFIIKLMMLDYLKNINN